MKPPVTDGRDAVYRFVFLADMQLGAYATFSGMSAEQVEHYQEALGMRVQPVPRVEGYEWDARRYSEAVEIVNAMRPDLVLIGGDMVDDPNSEDQYDEYMRITANIDGDLPVHWVPGNHDVAFDTVIPTPESLAEYRAAFGDDHWALDHGPFRIVGVNTSVIDHPENVPGEWPAQRDFVEAEFIRANEEERIPILVGHHPLFLHDADEEDDYWNLPIERRSVLLELVHRHRVPLGLAGHWHRNSEASADGFSMITTGPVGYPLGTDPSGFRIVEFDGERVSHHYQPLRP
jgi:3',5'-cyclic AMP phosphodiesterase CpdA